MLRFVVKPFLIYIQYRHQDIQVAFSGFTAGATLGKHSKPGHHHKPAIERAVPIERIIDLFSKRFDDPYLNPSAELSFLDFTSGLPDLPTEELEEALAYWTGHSGQKLLQTKTVEEGVENTRVWYLHGLTRPHLEWSNSSQDRLESAH